MRPKRVYLLHPGPQQNPAIAGWIAEVEELIRTTTDWDEWDLHCIQYNERNGFDVQPLFVRVLNKPGPVILFEGVQRRPLADIRAKLGIHAVVLVRSPGDSTELWAIVDDARQRHINGEPLLPRKFVVAVLIVRKLRHRNYWGGNAKGYLWRYELAKGRGVDERFADIVDEVANDLLLHKILIQKTSQALKKYALNPERRTEIHAIADDGLFRDKHLERILLRDRRQESASYLHRPHSAQAFTILASGEKPHRCDTASAAVAQCRGLRRWRALRGTGALRQRPHVGRGLRGAAHPRAILRSIPLIDRRPWRVFIAPMSDERSGQRDKGEGRRERISTNVRDSNASSDNRRYSS